MAEDKNIDPSLINKLKEAFVGTKKEMKELYAMSTAYGASLKMPVEEVNKMIAGREKELKLVDVLHKTMQRVGSETERGLKLQNLTNQLQETANDIATEQNRLMSDLVLKQTMLKTGLTGVYAEQAKNYKILLDQGEITEDLYNNAIKRLQQDQKHNHHLQEELDLQESIAESLLEIKEESEAWKHSLTKAFETAKAIGRDPKVFGAFLLGQMAEKVHEVYEGFEELGKSGLTVGQRVDSMVKGFSLMSMIGLSDTKGVLAEMAESMGTLNSLTSSEVDHVGHLAKEMGVTGQEAFQLVEGFSKLPGETMATAAHAADYVKSLSKANGVAPGKITKEIAKNTELIALGGYKGAKAFTDAAMKAQKMGVELSTTKNVMSGLLNFEDSINKQMEASVLLGKEINLDRARQLALEGKSVEATQEVLKNIGGQAEFEKMNVLQKQALAAASGMTVEELNKAVDAQVEYNKYHGEDVAAWKTGLGYAMEYGGAVGGFLKENGLLLLSTIQFMSQFNVMTKIGNGLLAIKNGLLSAGKALIGKGGGADKTKDLVSEKLSTPDTKAPGGPADKAGSMSKINGAKLLQAAAAMLVAAAAIFVFAKATQELEKVKEWDRVAMGLGLFAGSMLVLGLVAKFVGAPLAILSGVLLAFGVSVLLMGAGVAIAAVGLSLFMKALTAVPIDNLLAIGPAFLGIGAGIYAIAAAAVLIAPAAIGLGLFFAILAGGALAVSLVAYSLNQIAESSKGLTDVGDALMNMGNGLASIATNGLKALPIFGALTGLATVAPMLAKLGESLGGIAGGGEGKKEDEMGKLIEAINDLKKEVSKGGVVMMDAKKVGDTLRLYGLNSSAVRV